MPELMFVHGIWQGSVTAGQIAESVHQELSAPPSSLQSIPFSVVAPTYGYCYRRDHAMNASSKATLPDPNSLFDETGTDDHLIRELADLIRQPAAGSRELGVNLQRADALARVASSSRSRPLQRAAVHLLREVAWYLNRSNVRACVQRTVRSAIGTDTRVVVAHSLGSVVAYEVLRDWGSSPVPLLLTIGSPLNLSPIRAHMIGESEAGLLPPPRVDKWINVAAPDDFVSASPKLELHYEGVTEPTRMTHVGPLFEHPFKPHQRTRFLSIPEVQNVIADELAR